MRDNLCENNPNAIIVQTPYMLMSARLCIYGVLHLALTTVRYPFLIVVLAIWLPGLKAFSQIPETGILHESLTLDDAKAWCDTVPIHYPEGIYSFPAQNSVILIKALRHNKSLPATMYELINIESYNILLAPGQVIGYIQATGDPTKYKLTLYSRITTDKLSKPKVYSAKYVSSQGAFTYEKPVRRISFNPLSLIPKLNRLLRITSHDPSDNIVDGFMRIYPEIIPSAANSPLFPLYF